MSRSLRPEKALVFRIVHRDHVPWLLDHGLHAPSSGRLDPAYVPIGSPELIEKRRGRVVPVGTGGTLADYVPFYFPPWSPMLLNVVTGRGVPRRNRGEIVFLIGSLHDLPAAGIPFVGTDRHAYLKLAQFSTDVGETVRHVDWASLQRRDFRRDPDDPGRFDRYQAECLVWRHLEIRHLRGIACQNDPDRGRLERLVAERGLSLPVRVLPEWYFPDA